MDRNDLVENFLLHREISSEPSVEINGLLAVSAEPYVFDHLAGVELNVEVIISTPFSF